MLRANPLRDPAMRLPVLIALLCLAACGPRAPYRDEKIGVRECEKLGYERGNSDFVSCVQKIVMQERSQRNAALEDHLVTR